MSTYSLVCSSLLVAQHLFIVDTLIHSVHLQISLIDQDLSLLQRLLTLNDRIDDLKCCGSGFSGSRASGECSCTQQHSFYGECFDDEDEDDEEDLLDIDTYSGKYPSPSSLSLFQESAGSMATSVVTGAVAGTMASGGSMCSGLDVIIDVTADSDYDEALLPEVKKFSATVGDDEGYSTEQRPDRTVSLLIA